MKKSFLAIEEFFDKFPGGRIVNRVEINPDGMLGHALKKSGIENSAFGFICKTRVYIDEISVVVSDGYNGSYITLWDINS